MIGSIAIPPRTAMNPEFGTIEGNVKVAGFSSFTGGVTGGGGGGTPAALIYTLYSDFRGVC